jgi:5-methylcytosine-specific restriction endonuclease McrA
MTDDERDIYVARRAVQDAHANLMRILRRVLLKRDGPTCHYCNVETIVGAQNISRECTVDHVVPVSRGGKDELENLVISCRSCNSRKGAKMRNSLL